MRCRCQTGEPILSINVIAGPVRQRGWIEADVYLLDNVWRSSLLQLCKHALGGETTATARATNITQQHRWHEQANTEMAQRNDNAVTREMRDEMLSHGVMENSLIGNVMEHMLTPLEQQP